MRVAYVVLVTVIGSAASGLASASREAEAKAEVLAAGERDATDEAYERGTSNLDAGHWAEAIAAFDSVAKAAGKRADAALYWKAYALNKAGRRPEALEALQALQKGHAQSKWIDEAKALDLEMRQAAGQAPRVESEGDDDLKLMALNGLMGSNPDQALPMLEKLLAGSSPPHLRERALFVLAQSGSPKARDLLARTAKDGSNPESQRKAIEFLALFGGAESRQILESLYTSATDIEVKKAILHTYLITGDKARALAAAKGEKNPELRREAIHMLGAMGAQGEAWELYQSEGSAEARKAILQALFIGGAAEKIGELARTEKDPELRREAIRTLGFLGRERTGAILAGLYGSESDVESKKAVLQGLFVQGNAEALVEIARKEKDRELRKEAVAHLSHMNSKAGTDFMLEILNK